MNTAYSRVLSRAAIIIVFPSTSIIIPIITKDITFIEVMIALVDCKNPCVNALSVSVLVSAVEFLNSASISSEILADCDGSLIFSIYHPT